MTSYQFIINSLCVYSRPTHLPASIITSMKMQVNNTLHFLDVLIMKMGINLVTKVYRKPNHTRHNLHFESNYPHRVKGRVVHRLSYFKIGNFLSIEIKNIRHYLMLIQHSRVFVNSIKKPGRSNRPSNTIHHDMIIIPYAGGISENFRLGNRFNVRTFQN